MTIDNKERKRERKEDSKRRGKGCVVRTVRRSGGVHGGVGER
jgi:hypothetical protein